MSDQEQTSRDDEQHTDEQMQDLDVAEEQQDDVTGGARRSPGQRGPGVIGDSHAK